MTGYQLLLCGRCALTLPLRKTGHTGAACPRCGDRAVECVDLPAPRRRLAHPPSAVVRVLIPADVIVASRFGPQLVGQ